MQGHYRAGRRARQCAREAIILPSLMARSGGLAAYIASHFTFSPFQEQRVIARSVVLYRSTNGKWGKNVPQNTVRKEGLREDGMNDGDGHAIGLCLKAPEFQQEAKRRRGGCWYCTLSGCMSMICWLTSTDVGALESC